MNAGELVSESALLCQAIGVPHETISLHSREPLGQGSITGLEVAGETDLLYFVDTSRIAVRAETGLASSASSDPEVRIWLHPADPHLPALAPVAFDGAAETLLSRLSLTAQGSPAFVAYRPGRRAVLSVPTADGPVWIKVVRPTRVRQVVEAHAACAAAGLPVPSMHGWSADGLIVMADATGTAAADVEWEPEALVDEVDRLREGVARVPWDVRATSVAHRIDWYAARATPPLQEVLGRARELIADAGERPSAVVHGDLHFGQLFLDDAGRISCVIDVDTLGVGDPAEDPAAFLSHAIASARLTAGGGADRVWALASAGARRWGADPLVRALASVHLVGHAVAAKDRGDIAAQDELCALSDALLRGPESVEGIDESRLITVFDSP